MAVDFACVDRADIAGDDDFRRLFDIGRNTKVAGEMIERPQRQYAERNSGSHQPRGDCADGAVTAAGNDDPGAGARRALRCRDELVASARGNDLRVDAGGTELFRQPVTSFRSGAGSRRGVDDYDDL